MNNCTGLMILQLAIDNIDTTDTVRVKAIRGKSQRGSGNDESVDRVRFTMSVIIIIIDSITIPVHATHVKAMFRVFRLYLA